jgi:uncharacterized protein
LKAAILPNVLAVFNQSKGTELCRAARTAVSLRDRTIGLLMTPTLSEGEGLWLSPCPSIHTFFMRYPIDVLFVDAQGKVLSGKTYQPWRLSRYHSQAAGALELPAGTMSRTHTAVGDRLTMREVS